MNAVAVRGSWAAGVVAALLLLPFVIQAAEFRAGEQLMLGSEDRITGNLYVAAGTVQVAGSAAADVVGAGGTVLISGPVGGDVLAAGGNVDVLGAVTGDARVAGGNLTVQGPVGGDLLAGGGQVIIGSPTIGGDVAVGAGTVTLSSQVAGTVRIAGGDVVVDGPIAGDLYVRAETVTLTKRAAIAGNFTYTAKNEAVREEGASVAGETVYTPIAKGDWKAPEKGNMAAVAFFGIFIKFLMQLTAALVVALFFRRYAEQLVAGGIGEALPALGLGFVSLVVWPVAAILLLVTMIGVPLGIMALLGYVLLLIFAWILAPVVLGAYLHKAFFKPMLHEISWRTILLGAVAYTVLSFIPIIGWLVQFALMLVVLGRVARIKWAIAKQWR